VGRTSGELAGTGTSGDHGRGRRAVAPWQIFWKGWKDILVRTYEQLDEDRVLAVAAGVVFYGLLVLFPATTAPVSCYALFAKARSTTTYRWSPAFCLAEVST
jgi:membrane protein